jgi:hypothetical protein
MKQKKSHRIITFLFIIIAGLTLSSCTRNSNTENIEYCENETSKEGYEQYQDDKYDFQFSYPQDWELTQDDGDVYLSVLSQLQNNEDVSREGLNISITQLSEKETRTDLAKAVDNAIDNTLKNEVEDFDLIRNEDFKLSGLKAKKLHYTWTYNDFTVDTNQIITISKTKQAQYIITYSNFEEDAEAQKKWEDIFNKMVNSFCFREES